jgi:hypothetical protein
MGFTTYMHRDNYKPHGQHEIGKITDALLPLDILMPTMRTSTLPAAFSLKCVGGCKHADGLLAM